MQKYQVLARRYRPQRFQDVVGQDAAVTTLKNAIRFDKIAHAYLFCGSRGIGKTTLARLFAKALNCSERGQDFEPCGNCASCIEIGSGQSLDVIEIDGASNRGIDDIRQINETVGYAPSSGRFKIYIIDEVHMLTKEAFNALLKTLEEPPARVKFFFATTEPHKVLPTILSRCQRFDLSRIPLPQIISKLQQIAIDLGRSIDEEALHLIGANSDGSLRDAESLLDQIFCFSEEKIGADAVRQALGLVPQEHFFTLDVAFSEARAAFAFELVELLFQSGKDLSHFFEQLIEHYRLLSIMRTVGEKGLALPPELSSRYIQSARLYSQPQALYILDHLLHAEVQFHRSLVPRVFLEATLLHIIRSKNRIPVEVLVRRLSEIEQSLTNHIPLDLPPPEKEKRSPAEIKQQAAPVEAKQSVETPQAETPPVPEPEPIPEPEPETEPSLPPPSLKPTPFNPYIAEPLKHVQEVKKEAPVEPKAKSDSPAPPLPPTFSASGKHPSHYDTLIRFAAIELEGNVHRN